MDFRQVRYFLAVAEHESFRRAAETVHVAQSALSKHIAELEARLEVRLFDRLPTGVRLTQAGHAYAGEARRAVELMDRADIRARKAQRGEIDRLTIAMNDIGARSRRGARRRHLFSCLPGSAARLPVDDIAGTTRRSSIRQDRRIHHDRTAGGTGARPCLSWRGSVLARAPGRPPARPAIDHPDRRARR